MEAQDFGAIEMNRDYEHSRTTTVEYFAEQHGQLTLEGQSVFRDTHGNRLFITFAHKGEKSKRGALNLRRDKMLELEDSGGVFAFAYYEWDDALGYFFEVPMREIAQHVRDRKLTLSPDRRYGMGVFRHDDRFQLSQLSIDITNFLVGKVELVQLKRKDTPGKDLPLIQQEKEVEREYDADQFLAETYLDLETLEELEALLNDKQQIILYGPPGTGKTYVAQKLARYFVGGDESRVQLIQFHPSYSYEEFMEGIRPEARDDGPPLYPVREGVFRSFCEAARGQEGRYVMIIDEINRGNIAKIFGELMFLLEYRDRWVPLPYSGEHFCIPDNVFVVGTMNTADRSIALVDFALRRRFHFVHFGADRDVLARWIKANGAPVPYLLDLFDTVNAAIEDHDYQIGFSYFMRPRMTQADLRRVWRYSVEPYLEEYFFDNRAKVDELRWDALVSRFQADHGSADADTQV